MANSFSKKFHLERLNNTNPYFDESYSWLLFTHSQFLSLTTPSPILQLSYGEERYLKQVLENYRFCQNSVKDKEQRKDLS